MRGMGLAGRTAVVTGGGSGIGAAVCADLAALGADVVVADVDEAATGEVAKALDGRAARVDVGDPEAIDAFCAGVGAADIVVHAAGVSIVEPFVTSDPRHWELMWAVNLRGPMLLTQRLLPGMLDRGWGRLVFISSDGAKAGSGGEGAYAATKAGLFGLAKTLAREAARGNVTSNVVCPGPTDTPMLRRAATPELVDKLVKAIPMRRLGSAEDVAGLVAYLCTDRAAYITGQTLSVSGGVTMQ